MRKESILGLEHIKKHLLSTVENGRIAHAQLLVGPSGSGTLPLAIFYARAILCQKNPDSCHIQMDQLAHPDLHFSFPSASTKETGSKATSDDYLKSFRSFVKEHPYGNISAWAKYVDLEKKNVEIKVGEGELIMKKLSLKSYEGGYKVLIMWQADRMNSEAANKLLKLIEEPPKNTVILLVAENTDRMLNTIISRCQVIEVPKLPVSVITAGLQLQNSLNENESTAIARQANGDFFKALELASNISEDNEFEELLIKWVRTAYQAKTKPSAITELINWATAISSLNREKQQRFLNYAVEFFRQAMLLNYKADRIVYLNPKTGFDLKKFAPFITGNRMIAVQEQIETSLYHIQRNGNGKVILTDLAIGMTRILHGPS
ncbi:ATP-binding protein [Nonlabens sp. SY33080]|uniref:DNA polymerase III subunit n=1 Tax=Nonlabens sp. SY33080 TaxID=2719911 RepID=UPI00142897A7|nr:DNA polymerase III subunit delta' [Nonlabens sp. SY33080]